MNAVSTHVAIALYPKVDTHHRSPIDRRDPQERLLRLYLLQLRC